MALPNGPLEIVFSFDTTGSMSGCLNEVRGRVSDMVQRLQADIPGIRFAIFAHGDYCDRSNYITKFVDFTDDVGKLCDFVKNVSSTGGGDSDECYELVLYEVRTKLSWQPGSQRALVMIGDARPHEPSYPQNTMKLDWRKESAALGDMGVRIYGVNCGSWARQFYEDISSTTHGHYLELSDFKQVFDMLMSVCYNEKGADMLHMYEKEVRARCGPVHKDLDKLFGDLRDTAPPGTSKASPALKPLPTITIGAAKPGLLKKASIPKPALKPSAAGVVKKYRKSRMPATARKTMKDSIAKYRLENLPKHHREEVPENHFLLGDMAWSKWQLVLSNTAKPECSTKRGGRKTGYRTQQLFSGSTNKPALYEIAVQPKFRCRKFVVHSRCSSKGFVTGLNWEKSVFGKKTVADQIESVVKRGCDVFIRRALLKSVKQTEKARQNLRRYDYAWSVVRPDRKSHRPVTRAGVNISEHMEIET